MSEFSPSMPPVVTGSVDPSLVQATDPLAQRRFENLTSRPEVTEYDISSGGEHRFDLDSIKPLANIANEIGMVASIQLGGGEAVQIWGMLNKTGKFQSSRGLIVAGEDFDPTKMTQEQGVQSIVQIFPDQTETVGRHPQLASSQRLNLSQYVSNKHLSIELHDGKLTLKDLFSSNGTKVAVENIAVPEDEHETAVESKIGQTIAKEGESFTLVQIEEQVAPAAKEPVSEAQNQSETQEVANPGIAPESLQQQEQEPAKPDLAAIFSSGHNLDIAMQDPANTEIMPGLREVARAWKEVQLAAVTNEVWGEILQPRLAQVQELIPRLIHTNEDLLDATQNIAQNLRQAARSLEEGDIESFGRYWSHYMAPARERFNESPMVVQNAASLDEMQRATNVLNAAEMDSDERLRRVAGASMYGSLTEVESERLAQQVKPLVDAGQSLQEISATLRSGLPEDGGQWRQRQQAIQEAIMMSNGASYVSGDGVRAMARARNEFELLGEEIRRGRFDPAQMNYVSALMEQVAVGVGTATYFLQHANRLTGEIK